MATLAAIRQALKARLDTIPNSNASAYFLSNPTPPAMHILPGETEYDVAFHRGLDHWTMTIQGFVSLSTDIGAQVVLDDWLAAEGPNSVKAAVEGAGPTLGGVVQDCSVTAHGGYQPIQVEGRGPMLMAEWTVEILATSS